MVYAIVMKRNFLSRRKLAQDPTQQEEERQSAGSMSDDDSWLVNDMADGSEGTGMLGETLTLYKDGLDQLSIFYEAY